MSAFQACASGSPLDPAYGASTVLSSASICPARAPRRLVVVDDIEYARWISAYTVVMVSSTSSTVSTSEKGEARSIAWCFG